MSSLDLGFTEKDDVQSFVEALQNAGPRLTGFTMTFAHGNEAAGRLQPSDHVVDWNFSATGTTTGL